jgi:hypothetical protein
MKDDKQKQAEQSAREAIRASYKVFLGSLAGKDLIEHLLTLEIASQATGIKSENAEQKAFAIERIGVCYNLRTYLNDMAKPTSSQPISSAGSK